MAKPTVYKVLKDVTDTVDSRPMIVLYPSDDKFVVYAGKLQAEDSIETLIDTPGVSLNTNQFNTFVYYAMQFLPDVGTEDIIEE